MSLTFRNSTQYIAAFVVHKGDFLLARLPGLEPDATLEVPVNDDTYQVTAETIANGNTYTTAPLTLSGPASYLAQVQEQQGTYDFNVVTSTPDKLSAVSFQKTCLGPVMFSLSRYGQPLQQVYVQSSFEETVLQISNVFTVYAIVNGITTITVTTANPNATITVVNGSGLYEGGFELVVS